METIQLEWEHTGNDGEEDHLVCETNRTGGLYMEVSAGKSRRTGEDVILCRVPFGVPANYFIYKEFFKGGKTEHRIYVTDPDTDMSIDETELGGGTLEECMAEAADWEERWHKLKGKKVRVEHV